MDLKHLREQARGRRMDADSRRKQAAQLTQNAAVHKGDGNPQTAQAEETQAAQLNDEANRLEAEAVTLDRQADNTEREIQSIEQQKARLEQEFNQQINELDKQRTNLLGTSGLF